MDGTRRFAPWHWIDFRGVSVYQAGFANWCDYRL